MSRESSGPSAPGSSGAQASLFRARQAKEENIRPPAAGCFDILCSVQGCGYPGLILMTSVPTSTVPRPELMQPLPNALVWALAVFTKAPAK